MNQNKTLSEMCRAFALQSGYASPVNSQPTQMMAPIVLSFMAGAAAMAELFAAGQGPTQEALAGIRAELAKIAAEMEQLARAQLASALAMPPNL